MTLHVCTGWGFPGLAALKNLTLPAIEVPECNGPKIPNKPETSKYGEFPGKLGPVSSWLWKRA